MRNVHAIPTLDVLRDWLEQAGLSDIKVLDVCRTTIEEQRSTDWMTFESLSECLDNENPSRSIEGYPAPVRAALVVQV
jgi:tRNA (mo5U34)-methyltransferase